MSADGKGLVSGAGTVLLWETLRVTGLGRGLSAALEQWRAPRAVHDPGKLVADLAAALALCVRPFVTHYPSSSSSMTPLESPRDRA